MEALADTRPSFLAKHLSPLFLSLSSIFTGLAASFALGIVLLSAWHIYFAGRIFPGVSIGDVDLSGMSAEQAAAILEEHIDFTSISLITFRDGNNTWNYTPEQLGMSFDALANAIAAREVGRRGWPWTRLFEQYQAIHSGFDLSPHFVFDGPSAQAALNEIALQINQQSIEGALTIRGFTVQAQQGQIGRSLDVWATTGLLSGQLVWLQAGEIPLVIHEDTPDIVDVSSQAEIARRLLGEALTIRDPDSNQAVLTLERNQLGELLEVVRIQREGNWQYRVQLNPIGLASLLSPLVEDLSTTAKNARFIFNDDTRQLDLFASAVIGRSLLIPGSVEHINEQISTGAHNVDLLFEYSEPEVGDDTIAADLGITELIQSQTTYFYGSSAGRIQNIQTAAAQFHGLFVAPGAVFSMAENIGDISLDSGYAESLIIYGDRTVQGVGGGVCQVSTTLFRTVFFAGFPVVERYQHAYRVYYYELNASGAQDSRWAGLDATLYTPLVDFKFKNDSDYWLLMETYVNPGSRSITWKFYSTSDGRQVDWGTSGLTNIKQPPAPVYEENEDLAQGEVEQVDWAVSGADVHVTRNVTKDGQLLFTDQFTTHYEPWAMVCQYGPKTKGFPPKKIDREATSCHL